MDDYTSTGPITKARKFESIYCPHCKKNVSKSAYYEHYNKYFNTTTRSWQQVSRQGELSKKGDFDFHSECQEKSIMETDHEALSVGESGDECYDMHDVDCYMFEDDHFDQQIQHSDNAHNVS